ncbi:putative Insulin-degrading enzyme [Monocercomonoides exilis]|uniref:putative Insulin-degrading enzyme n=1 Tax=Monocercomonoides exilis TaxID=2049356 RepID=UPI00355947D1|nr:putative Insulin-degrading enzyme [Monocercomonoides exilis]|eukprot:MONOS_1004.1-p1 / transcript=MONOS_1004.1 / gene=MONOS_1004 / organism=Monocercomonoides_exilis_PA203 / gene_product=Insulin-degrading enzyme / transcript_product=Insulin-degrading enzyme / location=Mono_scaffold00016:245116-249680(+) / protein_length=1413 / sequence_SO=supercontig / SO=protein_coding / is_pseudo=false
MSIVHDIITPLTSKKTYRCFTLKNGMKALVVSNPGADKSAAAIRVSTGAIHDPNDRFGLSHFLEHMLFLGTKKYPKEGEFSTFLTNHAGSQNGFTSLFYTKFYFVIDSRFFEEAIDRFAQFFIEPLFTESCTEREIEAVNSEYEMNLNVMSRKLYQMMRYRSNPDHYLNGFSCGRRDTLNPPGSSVEETRLRLIKLFEKYYSAKLMTLCLVGNKPLDELQKIAETYFNEIRSPEVTSLEEEILGAELADRLLKAQEPYLQPVLRILKDQWPSGDEQASQSKSLEEKVLEWNEKYKTFGSVDPSGIIVVPTRSHVSTEKDATVYRSPLPPSPFAEEGELPIKISPFLRSTLSGTNSSFVVVPSTDTTATLTVGFFTPTEFPMFYPFSRPEMAATLLLGHEGEGSLASFLKKKALITELIAGIGDYYPDFERFYIKIMLTELGEQKTDEIIAYCLEYIEMLKHTPVPFPVQLLAERRNVYMSDFNLNSEMAPDVEVMFAVENLANLPTPFVVLGGDHVSVFDEDAFRYHISWMKPENMDVILTLHNDRIEDWMKERKQKGLQKIDEKKKNASSVSGSSNASQENEIIDGFWGSASEAMKDTHSEQIARCEKEMGEAMKNLMKDPFFGTQIACHLDMEPFYSVIFFKLPLSEDYFQKVAELPSLSPGKSESDWKTLFHLPHANRFIATDFSIIPFPDQKMCEPFAKLQEYGQQVINSDDEEKDIAKERFVKKTELFERMLQDKESGLTSKRFGPVKIYPPYIVLDEVELNQKIDPEHSNSESSASSSSSPSSSSSSATRLAPFYPFFIHKEPGLQVLYKPTPRFREPQVHVRFDLTISSELIFNPDKRSYRALFADVVMDSLQEISYEMQDACMTIKVEASNIGLAVLLSGFSDKMENAIDTVAKEIFCLTPSLARYELQKQKLITLLVDSLKTMPASMLYGDIALILRQHAKSTEQTIEDLKNEYKYDDFCVWINDFRQEMNIFCTVVGNATSERAIQFAVKFCQHASPKEANPAQLQCSKNEALSESSATGIQGVPKIWLRPLSPSHFPFLRNIIVPPTNYFVYDQLVKLPTENNGAVMLTLFAPGRFDIQENATLTLLTNYLQPEMYERLRTKEQLCYILWTTKANCRGVAMMFVIMQGNRYNPLHFHSRIDAHVNDLVLKLSDMSDEDYEKLKQSVLSNLSSPPKTMISEASNIWTHLIEGDFDYAYKEKMIYVIQNITKEEFCNKASIMWCGKPLHLQKKKEEHKKDDASDKTEEEKKEETDCCLEDSNTFDDLPDENGLLTQKMGRRLYCRMFPHNFADLMNKEPMEVSPTSENPSSSQDASRRDTPEADDQSGDAKQKYEEKEEKEESNEIKGTNEQTAEGESKEDKVPEQSPESRPVFPKPLLPYCFIKNLAEFKQSVPLTAPYGFY